MKNGGKNTEQLKLMTELEQAVKMRDLKTVMRLKKISGRSMVELMRTEFPRFDKTLLSKVRNPEAYGVVLHPRGFNILNEFPDRRTENRTLKKRIYGRLNEEEFTKLTAYIEKDGYKSVQDWLREQVQFYIMMMDSMTGGQE